MSISALSGSTYAVASVRRSSTSGSSAASGACSGGCGTSSCSTCNTPTDTGKTATGSLTPDQQKQVEELKKRDAEVRQHEAAHLAAAGSFAKGGPVYNYQRGPDGRSYAVGGHVNIDTSAIAGNPRATLAKAQQVQRAALAPADPSGQDQSVAAAANAQAAKALSEIAKQSAGGGASGEAAGKPIGTSAETANSTGTAGNTTSSRSAKARSAYANASSTSPDSAGGLDTLG